MRTISSREIFTKKGQQQQNFDSDPKEAWHYNHETFTPIAKKFMLYCWWGYQRVGWYPHKKTGSSHLNTSPRWTSCFPVFTRKNLEFTAVNEWNAAFCGRFPVFYETVNTAESWKKACIPAFSDRLPLGELRIITTFASSFLAFSFISRQWNLGFWEMACLFWNLCSLFSGL